MGKDRFGCVGCSWEGRDDETSVLRSLDVGVRAYVDLRDGRILPSCPLCFWPCVRLERARAD